MEKITIKGFTLFAYHGVNPEEKEEGQRFMLDLTLLCDLSLAKISDRLEDTVNYAAVRKVAEKAFTACSYNLIERAAHAVCQAVLEAFPKVEEITCLLQKPEAPMNAVFDYVSVELTETRKGALA